MLVPMHLGDQSIIVMVEFELNQLIIELNAIAGKTPKRKENSANNAAVSKAEVEISGICG